MKYAEPSIEISVRLAQESYFSEDGEYHNTTWYRTFNDKTYLFKRSYSGITSAAFLCAYRVMDGRLLMEHCIRFKGKDV